MIGVISLYELLTRYGINLNNIPSIKQDSLLNNGEVGAISGVLDFLIKENNVPVKNKGYT